MKLSTAFHPQTDSQAERTIQTLEDMVRSCFIDFKESCDKQLPLVEFSYNHSFRSYISMDPYESCMVGVVDLQLGSLMSVGLRFLVPILFIRL